ncbi:hypothetical protein V6N13_011921 [Hibiscus sabdariffa]
MFRWPDCKRQSEDDSSVFVTCILELFSASAKYLTARYYRLGIGRWFCHFLLCSWNQISIHPNQNAKKMEFLWLKVTFSSGIRVRSMASDLLCGVIGVEKAQKIFLLCVSHFISDILYLVRQRVKAVEESSKTYRENRRRSY